MTGKIPSNASVAVPKDGAKLHAPSAERNVAALTEMLRAHAPLSGQALEIASGTGQHISSIAAALPDIHWHPSEIDPTRRASIDAYVAEANLRNVAPTMHLNATEAGWAGTMPRQDLILLSNLLHLISDTAAETLITEAAKALNPNGTLILYGPFTRDGMLISEGDRSFDAQLRAADVTIGYKDIHAVIRWFTDAGLTPRAPVEMPANNLALIATKAAP